MKKLQYWSYYREMEKHQLSSTLTKEDYNFIDSLKEHYRFSFQQTRQIIEVASDLRMWDLGPVEKYWHDDNKELPSDKIRTKKLLSNFFNQIDQIKKEPTIYSDFVVNHSYSKKEVVVEQDDWRTLIGYCPCPSVKEKPRCCNLYTLDLVRQCGFECSYCSIQSFYDNDKILFTADIEKRLNSLELPKHIWHIGTGQSSDSLMWGNNHNVLSSLASFANKHKDVVIELKTKSARTDWLDEVSFPNNVVATWSLNGKTIIEKEEHGSASLNKRLEAALKSVERGMKVGFHLHPMVYYENWEEEYREIVEKITTNFDKKDVVMISFGTLTFTKEVLKQLRLGQKRSRVLQMEMVEVAGKYSYSDEIKINLFKTAYDYFPTEWKQQGPFFYLCMEKSSLWLPTLQTEYSSDEHFEQEMKKQYYKKLNIACSES